MCGPMLVDNRVEVAAAVFSHVHVQRREQDAAHHEREGNQCHDQATRNGGAHDWRIMCGDVRGGQPAASRADRGWYSMEPVNEEIRPVVWRLALPVADPDVSANLSRIPGRDARNRALEVGEAQRLAAKEMEEDDELPATIQPSDGLLDPGGSRCGRVCALTHGCVPHLRVRSCGVITCQICSTSMSTHANAPIHLPLPIAAYFAADASDANAVAQCFSESAIVIDERREHRGRPAIARWRTEALAKYHYTSEPLAVDVSGPEVTVTARVTGDFPGSPVELHYDFTLEGTSIARLEITA